MPTTDMCPEVNHSEEEMEKQQESNGRSTKDRLNADDDDAWLQEGLAMIAQEETEEQARQDGEPYKPQFMDEQEMKTLRVALQKGELRISKEGRFREYVPRKASPEWRVTTSRGRTVSLTTTPRIEEEQQQLHCPSVMCAAPPKDNQQHKHPTHQATTLTGKANKVDYSHIMRKELQQLRELELRYDDVKKMLLDQLDVICSSKPSERVGGPETYEKLAELMAYAAECRGTVD